MFLCGCVSLLLPLLLLRCAGAAAAPADCGGAFRSGPEDFVLDSEDAVMEGADLLDSVHVPSADACQRACCEQARCNLALLELRGRDAAGAQNHTCVLFNCIYRNQFVCRFVNQDGYRSFVRKSVFLKHLQRPDGVGESSQPISSAGHSRGHRVRVRGDVSRAGRSKPGSWCQVATLCDVTVWVVRSGVELTACRHLEFLGPEQTYLGGGGAVGGVRGDKKTGKVVLEQEDVIKNIQLQLKPEVILQTGSSATVEDH